MKENCLQKLDTGNWPYLYFNLTFRFIVNMHYAFQDSSNLYLLMDLLNGGDLRYHISRHKRFSEEQTSKTIWF